MRGNNFLGIWSVLQLYVVSSQVMKNGQGGLEAKFDSVLNDTRLAGKILLHKRETSTVHCIISCLMFKLPCRSINYNQATHDCELVEETLLDKAYELVREAAGWMHYDSLPTHNKVRKMLLCINVKDLRITLENHCFCQKVLKENLISRKFAKFLCIVFTHLYGPIFNFFE